MTDRRSEITERGDGPAARGSRGAEPLTLQMVAFNCSPVQDIQPQALGFTYWFDAKPSGQPYSVTIRFTGTRLGVEGKPGARDSFKITRTVDRVIPGSGRLAVTARVLDIEPGKWQVRAEPVTRPPKVPGGYPKALLARPPALPSGSSSGETAFAPVVRSRAPGVRLGAWPALVTTGTVVALVVQAGLARHRDVPMLGLLLISLIACIAGVVGAKLYYLLTHRQEQRGLLFTGMSIQGFVLTAIGTVVLGAYLADIPVGVVLDVTAPGLLFGMAVGRLGCFLGGCCVGKPTGSRWGLWSSDRSVGARRIPVQLLESAVAGGLGAGALLAVWLARPAVDGVVFVAVLAAYTFTRQLLFPLRGIPRTTAHGRTITMMLAALIVTADLALAVLA